LARRTGPAGAFAFAWLAGRLIEARRRASLYALRLNEVAMITSSPQKLIAQGTDWRFLTELKRELKGVGGGTP
jgi:hypothetical protein